MIVGSDIAGAKRLGADRVVQIAVTGFVSGVVIPYFLLLGLEVGLLVLALWGPWVGTTGPGASQGQIPGGAFFLALAHSLPIGLRHFWSFRWVGIAVGGVGMLTAMVGHLAARAGWGTEGATFLTILAISSFVTNSAAMLSQERRSALAAAERLALIYHQLARSHQTVLILGTTVAFVLALSFWNLWRLVYRQLAYRWRSTLPSITKSTEISGNSRRRFLVLALLVGVVGWLPLQRVYLQVAPAVTSGVVYLEPDDAIKLVPLVFGSQPQSISFSNAVGQGVADFRLEDEEGKILREIEGFRLMDLPGIAYNTMVMSTIDLSPGTYVLHLALRSAEAGTPSESALDRPGGVIGWGLLQGGGSRFRTLAVLMATLATFILIVGCILLWSSM